MNSIVLSIDYSHFLLPKGTDFNRLLTALKGSQRLIHDETRSTLRTGDRQWIIGDDMRVEIRLVSDKSIHKAPAKTKEPTA